MRPSLDQLVILALILCGPAAGAQEKQAGAITSGGQSTGQEAGPVSDQVYRHAINAVKKDPINILTIQGRNGSYDTNLAFVQEATGTYRVSGRNMTYKTEYSVIQDSSGAYQVRGKIAGYAATITISKNASGAYVLSGSTGGHRLEMETVRTTAGRYRATGRNLGYRSHLWLSGSGPFSLQGENVSHKTELNGIPGAAPVSGPDMKEPLPVEVLFVLGAVVGVKPTSL